MPYNENMVLFILLLSLLSMHSLPSHADITGQEKSLLNKDLSGIARGFIWGIPKLVVLEEERTTFMGEENGSLIYLDKIHGIRCTIIYDFYNDQLWRIRIFNEKDYIDMYERITDLATFQNAISRKFGTPIKEELIWKQKDDQDFPNSWGWTVYRGELLFDTQWRQGDTEVTAFLGAKKKYFPEMVFTYTHIPTKALMAQQKEQKLFAPLLP